MKLCFGTLAGVLHICGVDRLAKSKLLNTMVKSVDSTCELGNSTVTWLMQCTSNLPDGRSNSVGNVISGAQDVEPRQVAEYFAKKIIPLINPNKRKLAVLVLCDIIKNDEAISAGTVVDLVSGTTKKALLMQSQFVLSNFLAGVFLYTTTIDNRVGKEATEFITNDYLNSFMGAHEKIAFIVPQNESDIDAAVEAFNNYLVKTRKKYETIKTLLYKDNQSHFMIFMYRTT